MSINFSPEGSLPVEGIHCIVDQSRCMSLLLNVLLMIVDWCDAGQATIDILSDDSLLYVFDFYVAQASEVEAWHRLIHVCRRWRMIVFGSPRRLNLRIECTSDIPVRVKLNIWPALPIVISGDLKSPSSLDNIKDVLEHRDRVCQIKLDFPDKWYFEETFGESEDLPEFYLEEIFSALENPFPLLTVLKMRSAEAPSSPPIFPDPDKFLGGSAHLQSLWLTDLSIQGLPKLLLSSTGLVDLRLKDIVFSGYFSPDAMVTALSALTRLKVLHFTLNYDRRPLNNFDRENQPVPLLTRTVLPSLTTLNVEGFTQILEELVVRIDTPLLDCLHIALISYGFDFDLDTPQLHRFISRMPKFRAPDKAHIGVNTKIRTLWIDFSSSKQTYSSVRLGICRLAYEHKPERHIPRLVQFCHSPFSPLPTVEYLYIGVGQFSPQSQPLHGDNNTRWLELLQPFTAVKNLYLAKEFAPEIAHALKNLAEMVLPALENIFIERQPQGHVHKAIGKFAAARQLSGHPIVINHWDRRQGVKHCGESR